MPPLMGNIGASSTYTDQDWTLRWMLAIVAVAGLAVGLRLLAFSPFDIMHADELMQYLEQANRLATGEGIAPWETRFGVRNHLIPQLLSVPMWIGHKLAPGTLTAMYLARATFATLTLIALPAAWRLGALVSRWHALVALFVVAAWWESVLFSELLLSESLAASILLCAAALLLDPGASRRRLRLGGFMLALGVLVRLQYAPFAAVLFVGAVWREPARWRPLMAGGIAGALLGAASDLVAGDVPFAWVVVNFGMNIVEGRAARFGASGPFEYFVEFHLHFGAGALIFVILSALLAGRLYLPLLMAVVANIAVHSLIAHKEYRFIWVSALFLLVLAAIGSLRLIAWLFERRGKGGAPGPAAALVAIAVWAALSASSYRITGGFPSFRGGGAISRLAVAAAERPAVCRLALFDAHRAHIVPSLLPRPLPLSIVPDTIYEDGKPLPPELVAAANAFVAEHRPAGAERYRRVACLGRPGFRPCLYVRPGTCAPDSTYGYQQVLERMSL